MQWLDLPGKGWREEEVIKMSLTEVSPWAVPVNLSAEMARVCWSGFVTLARLEDMV